MNYSMLKLSCSTPRNINLQMGVGVRPFAPITKLRIAPFRAKTAFGKPYGIMPHWCFRISRRLITST